MALEISQAAHYAMVRSFTVNLPLVLVVDPQVATDAQFAEYANVCLFSPGS